MPIRFVTAGLLCLVAGLMTGCSQESDAPATVMTATPNAPVEPQAAPFPAGASQASPAAATPSTTASAVNVDRPVPELLSEAKQAIKAGDGTQALQLLNAAVAAAPQSVEPLLQRAELFSAADRKSHAIADLTRALELDPQNARTFNSRGYLKMSVGDLPGAAEDFSSAVGIDLNYPQPYNNRGLVRISEGSPEKALHDFDAALRIDADYLDAHNNRGYTLMLLKRHDEALATLSRAIELDPSYVNAWNNRGLTYKALEKYDEALADFSKAVELQPTQAKYYLHRSEALTALGRTAEAQSDVAHVVWMERLALINRRVTVSPNEYAAWLERAEHMRVGKRLDAALTDVGRAIQLIDSSRPEFSKALAIKARILLDQGQAEQAIEAANVAIKAGFNEEAHSVRGDAYVKLNQLEAAVEDYRAARRIDPQVREVIEKHAEQLDSAGKIEQAGFFRSQASNLIPAPKTAAAADDIEAPPFPIDVTQPAAAAADASANSEAPEMP